MFRNCLSSLPLLDDLNSLPNIFEARQHRLHSLFYYWTIHVPKHSSLLQRKQQECPGYSLGICELEMIAPIAAEVGFQIKHNSWLNLPLPSPYVCNYTGSLQDYPGLVEGMENLRWLVGFWLGVLKRKQAVPHWLVRSSDCKFSAHAGII